MRTTLDLPDDTFRELKSEAALRGLKLKELVTELIQSGLKRGTIDKVPTTRSALPIIRKSTGKVHPALSNRKLEAMLLDEDAND